MRLVVLRTMNSLYFLNIILVVWCLNFVDSKKSLPSYITLCHRNDLHLVACIKKAVEQIRPHLQEGIPELQIPSLNPLVLPQAGLDNGDNFRASFKNIEVYHANDFKVEHLDVDLEKLHISVDLSFPKIRIKSQYHIDGRILILQLRGQGPADGNFTDVSANVAVDGRRYVKKGKDYIDFDKVQLDLKLGRPVFSFGNIFGDNKELNDQTNKIINENIVDILDELRPVIDKTVKDFIVGVVKRIFGRFSFDELFPK